MRRPRVPGALARLVPRGDGARRFVGGAVAGAAGREQRLVAGQLRGWFGGFRERRPAGGPRRGRLHAAGVLPVPRDDDGRGRLRGLGERHVGGAAVPDAQRGRAPVQLPWLRVAAVAAAERAAVVGSGGCRGVVLGRGPVRRAGGLQGRVREVPVRRGFHRAGPPGRFFDGCVAEAPEQRDERAAPVAVLQLQGAAFRVPSLLHVRQRLVHGAGAELRGGADRVPGGLRGSDVPVRVLLRPLPLLRRGAGAEEAGSAQPAVPLRELRAVFRGGGRGGVEADDADADGDGSAGGRCGGGVRGSLEHEAGGAERARDGPAGHVGRDFRRRHRQRAAVLHDVYDDGHGARVQARADGGGVLRLLHGVGLQVHAAERGAERARGGGADVGARAGCERQPGRSQAQQLPLGADVRGRGSARHVPPGRLRGRRVAGAGARAQRAVGGAQFAARRRERARADAGGRGRGGVRDDGRRDPGGGGRCGAEARRL